MYLTPINYHTNTKTKQLNFQGSRDYIAKELKDAIRCSKGAMQELSRENFNSETLRTLLSPAFTPKHPNCVMAISTTNPLQPVEVAYKISQNYDEVILDIFPKGSEDIILGQKIYFLDTGYKGKMFMKSGYMSSDKKACKEAGVKGIGILERILQIKEAIKYGIDRIPCNSYARAVLFHIKTGFTPIPRLRRIFSMYGADKVLEELIHRLGSDIMPENYTPIIVSEGLFNKAYYIDVNTTQCIAAMRQIKQDLAKGICDEAERPFTRGQCIDLVLEGKNFDIWKKMLGKV